MDSSLLFFYFFYLKRFAESVQLTQSKSLLEVSPVQIIPSETLTALLTLTLDPLGLLFHFFQNKVLSFSVSPHFNYN